MLGGVSGQMVGGQIGGRPIELEHSGRISPFTHLQTQSADTQLALRRVQLNSKHLNTCLICMTTLRSSYGILDLFRSTIRLQIL